MRNDNLHKYKTNKSSNTPPHPSLLLLQLLVTSVFGMLEIEKQGEDQ